jgi:hypothetical protein
MAYSKVSCKFALRGDLGLAPNANGYDVAFYCIPAGIFANYAPFGILHAEIWG